MRTCFVTEFSRGQKIQQTAALAESQRDSHINVVPPPDGELRRLSLKLFLRIVLTTFGIPRSESDCCVIDRGFSLFFFSVDYPLEDGENVLKVDGFIREGSAEVLWEVDNEEKSVATIILDIICKVKKPRQFPK